MAVAVGVFLFLGSDSSDGGGNMVINAIKGEPEPVEVPFEVDIPNYDPDNGSLVPVQVTGTDYDDNDVDEVQYVDDDGEGLSLLPGSYELSIARAPTTRSRLILRKTAACRCRALFRWSLSWLMRST